MPQLNYMISVGCFLLYVEVITSGLDLESDTALVYLCNVSRIGFEDC